MKLFFIAMALLSLSCSEMVLHREEKSLTPEEYVVADSTKQAYQKLADQTYSDYLSRTTGNQ